MFSDTCFLSQEKYCCQVQFFQPPCFRLEKKYFRLIYSRSMALFLNSSRAVGRLGITRVEQPKRKVKINILTGTKLAIEISLTLGSLTKPEKCLKTQLISTVTPTVHTNRPRKRSFSKTLFKPEEFETAGFAL